MVTSPIQGSALVAGGNISLKGSVGNNARVAGGNITIDGPVTHDLVVAGGTVTVTKNATIGGDILFAGGQLMVNGPVKGKILANGREVSITNSVGGNVSGHIEKLTLGSGAIINGNLDYQSPDKAQIASGAQIIGQTHYQPVQRREKDENSARQFLTAAAVYKVIADIIITMLFIYFFRRFVVTMIEKMRQTPLKSGAIGFAFLILVPIAAFILLILIWLTGAILLFYFLTILVATYLTKAFLGWWILNWFDRNQKKAYELDWKAGIIGPLASLILSLIPFIGWIVEAIIFLVALGTLAQHLTTIASDQRHIKAPKK